MTSPFVITGPVGKHRCFVAFCLLSMNQKSPVVVSISVFHDSLQHIGHKIALITDVNSLQIENRFEFD